MNNPHLYEKIHHRLYRPFIEEVLSEFVPRLRWRNGGSEDEAVLDVGSGTGVVTRSMLLPLLPARVRRVVGADMVPEMVRFAQTTHAHADPRLRFVQADIASAAIDALPLRAEAGARGFSKIFSFFCLHWVRDQRTSLSNIFQLLQTHGEALVVLVAKTPFSSTLAGLSKQRKWQPYSLDVSNYIFAYEHCDDPGRDFSRILSEVGFHAIDCRFIQRSGEFKDMELVKDLLTSTNPFINRIPEVEKKKIKMDLFQEFLQQKQVTILNEKTDDMSIEISLSLLIALLEKRM